MESLIFNELSKIYIHLSCQSHNHPSVVHFSQHRASLEINRMLFTHFINAFMCVFAKHKINVLTGNIPRAFTHIDGSHEYMNDATKL